MSENRGAPQTLEQVVETACVMMSKAGSRIEQLIARVDALTTERADLLEALKWIEEDGASDARAVECARAAIAKASAP